jgi:hypothetical protein
MEDDGYAYILQHDRKQNVPFLYRENRTKWLYQTVILTGNILTENTKIISFRKLVLCSLGIEKVRSFYSTLWPNTIRNHGHILR